MPLPIIANVFQCVLNWHNVNAPRDAANVLHVFDTAGGKTPFQVYTALDTNVTAAMWNLVGSGAVSSVRVTPLDGVTAGAIFGTGSPAKWSGNMASADQILQGSQVISFRSTQRGPRGRNRIFLPWIQETKQVNGQLDGGSVAAAAGAWTTFLGAMSAASLPITVVSGVHLDHHPVTTIAFAESLYTQRRRARR